MESILSAFKWEVEENNALLRRLHEEEEKNKEKQSNRWTFSEDLKLRELVAVSGPQNWKHIGKKMQGRTAKTCRSRWFNHLDPRINNDAFSYAEEKKLLNAQRQLGSKWAEISRLFLGRTDRAVSKHWHKLMTQKLKNQSTSPDELTANDDDKTEGFTDSASDESREINNSSGNMPQEETTDLKAKYHKEAMVYSARHRRFSTFPAESFALLTRHVSISQPSSSSLNIFPDSASDESGKINSSSSKMPQEETTHDLKAKYEYLKEAMEYSARHHQFSNVPAVSLAIFTSHVSISQPSSSSSSLPSKAEDKKANTTPKFIDFLGVGDS